MGARVLAADVHITDGAGLVTVYLAGTTPKPAVAKKITNPSAWVEDDEDTAVPAAVPTSTPPATPAPPAGGSEAADAGAETGDGEEPARNASTEAWAAYAEGLGQAIPAGAGRDEIIAQLASAELIEA